MSPELEAAGQLDKIIEDVAFGTKGFSGRGLAKMMISLQAETFGNGGMLSKELFVSVVEWKIKQFTRRNEQYARAETLK